MVQSALDLKVWKEIAISKQMLVKTATDALGLDPECTEQELKLALERGIKQITEVESILSAAKEENRASISDMEKTLQTSEQARLKQQAEITELLAKQQETEALLDQTRTTSAQELKKVNSQLEARIKEIKAINTTLADTPTNVVKKLKALNKKKFDESTARKRAEDETRTVRKEKQGLEKKIKELDSTLAQAVQLVEKYRELRTFADSQYTQLKELVDDEDKLTALPELDEDLLNSIDPPE